MFYGIVSGVSADISSAERDAPAGTAAVLGSDAFSAKCVTTPF
jgi:hypothetical protein